MPVRRHTREMMSPSDCRKKAEACIRQAETMSEAGLKAGWLDLARHWDALATDATAQATTARLFRNPALFD
jgi:hypothetical protein